MNKNIKARDVEVVFPTPSSLTALMINNQVYSDLIFNNLCSIIQDEAGTTLVSPIVDFAHLNVVFDWIVINHNLTEEFVTSEDQGVILTKYLYIFDSIMNAYIPVRVYFNNLVTSYLQSFFAASFITNSVLKGQDVPLGDVLNISYELVNNDLDNETKETVETLIQQTTMDLITVMVNHQLDLFEEEDDDIDENNNSTLLS